MAVLTAAQILAANDTARELVHVREWGGDVYVRSVTAKQKDDFEALAMSEADADPDKRRRHIRAGWVVLTTCDESGAPLFTMDDREAISEKSAGAVDRIVNVAFRLNGVTRGDEDELVKNSERSRDSCSPTT